MPRRDRRIRALSGGLTDAQRDVLCHGAPLARIKEQPAFTDALEAAAAWRKHRAAIMAQWDDPGTRPAAYWRFDLGVAPVPGTRTQQLTALLDRGLIGAEEAHRIERAYPLLRPDQAREFCQTFARPECVALMDVAGLRMTQQDFGNAARWHAWRGRPELEEKYRRLDSVVRDVLLELAARAFAAR